MRRLAVAFLALARSPPRSWSGPTPTSVMRKVSAGCLGGPQEGRSKPIRQAEEESMAIVTISHEMGAGGSVIGMALAERLEYRYVDQGMISQAAQRYGCLEDKLTQLDETKPSFLERFDVETRHYITVLQSALLDVAEQDNTVIMGRSGQVLLRGSRTCSASLCGRPLTFESGA